MYRRVGDDRRDDVYDARTFARNSQTRIRDERPFVYAIENAECRLRRGPGFHRTDFNAAPTRDAAAAKGARDNNYDTPRAKEVRPPPPPSSVAGAGRVGVEAVDLSSESLARAPRREKLK